MTNILLLVQSNDFDWPTGFYFAANSLAGVGMHFCALERALKLHTITLIYLTAMFVCFCALNSCTAYVSSAAVECTNVQMLM